MAWREKEKREKLKKLELFFFFSQTKFFVALKRGRWEMTCAEEGALTKTCSGESKKVMGKLLLLDS